MLLNSKNYPPVSIIVLTYNGSDYIAPLLASLLDQSYPQDHMELIVVDNASTDETVEVVKKNYPSVHVVVLEKNIGFAAGNNEGLQHAKHDLLVFLNQDTVCHPDFLKSLVNVMASDATLAACNPNIVTACAENFNEVERESPQESLYVCDLSPFGYGQNRIISGEKVYNTKLLSGCAFIIRREMILKLGYLFDDQLWMYAEDTDLSLRIHNTGQRIKATKESIIFHLHNRNMEFKTNKLLLAGQAIKNRVCVFFKNMHTLEFIIFFPLLFFGGAFKIFEFPLPAARRALYFMPFSLFSMVFMIIALFETPRFAAKKRLCMRKRLIPEFSLLKLIVNC
jgi:hypothetical protein